MVEAYADGVDLNCGCPQRWALAEGIGACLIDKPQLVHDMLRATRRTCARQDFTVSAKIRVHDDLRTTVELCRRLEAAGVDYLAVHGRTKQQRLERGFQLCIDSIYVVLVLLNSLKFLNDF